MKYDFKTLSPIDFEDLIRDLLQEELEITLESFKNCKDGGVDLRCSKNQENEIIVQCKQSLESSFQQLFRKLKKEELSKVTMIRPGRYIFATGMDLTKFQKDKLKELFKPYIKNTGDIFARKEINNLIGKNEKIEKRHFKLWLTSVNILQQILHGKLVNFTKISLESILHRAKYHVQGDGYYEALKILTKHNLCIIAGQPGIGKTTLAEMIILNYANSGYDIVKVSGDISEALEFDPELDKRVYYYDDFLGLTFPQYSIQI